MEKRPLENEILALWLAPIVATMPVIPFFSIRSSPLFLGKLMADSTHPMNWPWLGPMISAMGIAFDGTILGYIAMLFVALPVYLVLRKLGRLSAMRMILIGIITAILASKFIASVQHFQQSGLREFATSWLSPVLACLCGGVAGLFVSRLSNCRTRLSETFLVFAFLLPFVNWIVCASTIAVSAAAWRAN